MLFPPFFLACSIHSICFVANNSSRYENSRANQSKRDSFCCDVVNKFNMISILFICLLFGLSPTIRLKNSLNIFCLFHSFEPNCYIFQSAFPLHEIWIWFSFVRRLVGWGTNGQINKNDCFEYFEQTIDCIFSKCG